MDKKTIDNEIMQIVKAYVKKVCEKYKIKQIILFGSYAKGTNNEDSDIDIAIFSKDFKNSSIIEDMSFLLIKTSGLGIDLQPQPFTLDDYSNPDGLVKEILDTGIELKVA